MLLLCMLPVAALAQQQQQYYDYQDYSQQDYRPAPAPQYNTQFSQVSPHYLLDQVYYVPRPSTGMTGRR